MGQRKDGLQEENRQRTRVERERERERGEGRVIKGVKDCGERGREGEVVGGIRGTERKEKEEVHRGALIPNVG